MNYSRPCPNCGANLDPGEKCVCRIPPDQSKEKREATPTSCNKGQINLNSEQKKGGCPQ